MATDRFAKLAPYVPFILRIGLALVFFNFAIDKFANAAVNISTFELLPIPHLLPVPTEVFLSGILELIIAVLLLIGFWSRVVGFFSAAYIAVIILLLGVTNVPRDIGLVFMALAIGILGDGKWSLAYSLRKRK